MTRRRRRRRRRASSRFPFEGEGRRRGEDAVAPRDARLRCGSGEEGETTPERRRGWRTRVGGSPSRRPKKNRRIVHGGAFFTVSKTIFHGSRFAGAVFPVCRFPVSEKPDCERTALDRRSAIAHPNNLRSIAPRRQKKSASAGRVKARAVRSRAHESARRGIDLETRACLRRTIRTSRTRVSRRTNAHRAKRTSAGDTLAEGRSISLEGYSEPSGGVPR
jgi:hypothetical protein